MDNNGEKEEKKIKTLLKQKHIADLQLKAKLLCNSNAQIHLNWRSYCIAVASEFYEIENIYFKVCFFGRY